MNDIPAFPCYEEVERYDDDAGKYRDHVVPCGGMTLRDYFAAKVVQGMYANYEPWTEGDDKLAEWAYCMADAMLKERAR